jgi:uncharacterized protein YceH (UPF0502 family)
VHDGGRPNESRVTGCLLVHDRGRPNEARVTGCLLVHDGGRPNEASVTGCLLVIACAKRQCRREDCPEKAQMSLKLEHVAGVIGCHTWYCETPINAQNLNVKCEIC